MGHLAQCCGPHPCFMGASNPSVCITCRRYVAGEIRFLAAGHRTMYKTDLRKFDVLFQKLLRSVVGPPAGMDWTRPWHEILHDWNGRVYEFVALHSIKLWSECCVQQYWELAHNFFSLEDQRWVKRVMQWQPDGRGRGGRPAHLWHTFLTDFCRWKGLRHWALEVRNRQRWMEMLPDFLHFVNVQLRLDEILLYFHVLTLAVLYIICNVNVVSFSLCPKRAAYGLTGATQLNSTQLNSTFYSYTQHLT